MERAPNGVSETIRIGPKAMPETTEAVMTNLEPGQASKWSLPLHQGQWRAEGFLPKLPKLRAPGRRASLVKRCWITAAILGLYGAACALPVFPDGSGVDCLVWGWMPPLTLPWSANLFLFVGLCYWLWGHVYKAYRTGFWGSSFALLSWVLVAPFNNWRLGPGYYCWQLSLIILAFSSWWEWYRYGSCEFEKPEPKLST